MSIVTTIQIITMPIKNLLNLLAIFIFSCNKIKEIKTAPEQFGNASSVMVDTLPPPYATPSVNRPAAVLGWPADKKPIAPPGFTVSKFATGLYNPRWIYQGPNGDIFIAEASTAANSINRITLFRDADKDGLPELRQVFLSNLYRPLGMLILNGNFYVANTDGIYKYPYQTGQTSITAAGKKILTLPAGGYNNHWTRNIIANASGTKIYVSVGSGTNAAEQGMANEIRRADILEINPDGSGERIFAAGLRNPVGLAWAPGTTVLYTAVNERDLLGDNLVPDYLTSVKDGGFYGWPYAYFGQHTDPRLNGQRPDLVAMTIVPEVDLGSHTASLGLTFYDKSIFPVKYRNGAFIGQHGSWNRSSFSGYKVVFIPFANSKPSGRPENFLTGFIANEASKEVYGRPAGVQTLSDGSLLVADDAANTLWRVSYFPPVKPGNVSPVAVAGPDDSLSLSWNYSPLLNGSYSRDPDGWVKQIFWTKIGGPPTFSMVTPNEAQTRVGFTAAGTYVFRVTVIDNLGAQSTDYKYIRVKK